MAEQRREEGEKSEGGHQSEEGRKGEEGQKREEERKSEEEGKRGEGKSGVRDRSLSQRISDAFMGKITPPNSKSKSQSKAGKPKSYQALIPGFFSNKVQNEKPGAMSGSPASRRKLGDRSPDEHDSNKNQGNKKKHLRIEIQILAFTG